MTTSEPATLLEQSWQVASGVESALSLTQAALKRAEAAQTHLNCFTLVRAEAALAEAAALDVELAADRVRGPLHGLPMVIKDENDLAGTPTSYGTSATSRPAVSDSEVVRKLRQAGVVLIGKTTMPEFGLWPWTESASFGVTRNPWDLQRSPGGSSGGTAAAVAAGVVAAGIGGDGGGSIRLPAAWCGLFGLKPQRGRVSAAPHRALWRSLGTIGPLTRTVADSALVYDAIAGTTPLDAYRAPSWTDPLSRWVDADPGPLRIGVIERGFAGAPDPDPTVLAALRSTAELLARAGHRVSEGTVRGYRPGTAFLTQVAAGVSDEVALVEHPDRLERRTRQGLSLARPLLRFANRAERQAADLADTVLRVFDEVDLLLTPTTSSTASPVGQLGTRSWLSVTPQATAVAAWTSPWNLLGNPAAAVPAGFTASGLPLSVQIVGPPNSEPRLIEIASQLEALRPWAHRWPPRLS